MSQLRTAQDIASLGTILCVWAHPDDETFTCAGLLATAAANGQRVVIVTATKGELGVQDEKQWPLATLGETRAKELQSALDILGIKEQRWLGYVDGSCATSDETEAISKLSSIIDECKPDTIMTFGPDGLTGHPDHIAAGQWAVKACNQASSTPVIYQVADCRERFNGPYGRIANEMNYYFDKPNPRSETDCDISFVLSDELCRKKCAALRAHTSQYSKLFESFPEPDIRLAFSLETFVRVK